MSVLGLLYWLSRLIAIAAIIHVVMDNRQPAKTIAWALVIYFIPIFGVVAYIFFGVDRRKERYISRRSMDMLTKRSMLNFVEQRDLHVSETYKPLVDLFVNESFTLPFNNNKVEVMVSGYEFFPALLRDIAAARNHIHLCMYIFEDDALGRLVADALIAKAQKGIEVRVVYDHVGCWAVKNRFFERLREGGVEVESFMPVRFPRLTSKANYRNHRKIIVIDGSVGYIGGMNIALRYVKGPGKKMPLPKRALATSHGQSKASDSLWRDTMVRIEGGGVYSLQRIFLIDWYFVDRTLLSDKKYYPPVDKSLACGDGIIQTVASGPVDSYPEIMQGYARIIMSSKRYVYIETPYFLPTESVLMALKTAAMSGVDVRVMVPRSNDAWFVEWASRSFLREAIEGGVQVKLYEGGFLHSKFMVSDDAVCTVGSTNVDFRSFENNFEGNVFFFGSDLSIKMKEVYLADERQCTDFDSDSRLMHPTFFPKLGESFIRLFSPLM